MRPIHSRMPVILDRAEESAWISDRTDGTSLWGILKTPYASKMRAYEVSREVNRASIDIPSLIEPMEEGKDDKPLFKTTGK
jgi:putative SOS response-associated peptidase YedK